MDFNSVSTIPKTITQEPLIDVGIANSQLESVYDVIKIWAALQMSANMSWNMLIVFSIII